MSYGIASAHAQQLPASLPRYPCDASDEFATDPLAFLSGARTRHGDRCVLRESGAVFSRTPDCQGTLAVFGAEASAAVLRDSEIFRTSTSAAKHLAMPKRVVNLNRGLQSMHGAEHAEQRALLQRVISETAAERRIMQQGAQRHMRAWAAVRSDTFALHESMRQLSTHVAAQWLFGPNERSSASLLELIQAHFELRRELSALGARPDKIAKEALSALGHTLDARLRTYIRACRRARNAEGLGVLAKLARAQMGAGKLSEDALVAHCNVLFISGIEPIAVTATWTMLVLSQLPQLRAAIRQELDHSDDSALLDRCLLECLRLLPPNALMVRVSHRETNLLGAALPARTEIVLCPFLEHRDPLHFKDPLRFLPDRWHDTRYSPYVYFPFGVGRHSCVARTLSHELLSAMLAPIIKQHDLVLAADEAVDWRIQILFMPSTDPRMRFARAHGERGGRLRGPVADLWHA